MIIKDLHLKAVAHFKDFEFDEDAEMQEIIELASSVTNSPMAVISFLDDKNAILKAKKGVTDKSVPLDWSFSVHVMKQDELMMVADTLLDDRFCNSPLVTDGPKVRFFAGMPLITGSGEKMGTITVLDTVPRVLDAHQQLVLKILASQVIKIMEVRVGLQLLEKKQRELQKQKDLNTDANIRLRSFFESSTNFQVLLGKHGEIIDFNKTAFNFIKTVHKASIVRGDQLIKYLAPDFVATFIRKYNEALQGRKSFVEGSTDYAEMGVIWWEAAFEVARNADNEIIGVSYLIRNVTERKLKEQKIISQNASLIKIAHIQAHEFRAPLTSIMGLMTLIKEEDYKAPKEYLEMLEQAVDNLDTTIRHVVDNIDKNVIPEYIMEG